MKVYDDTNWEELLFDPQTEDGSPQILPRVTRYGSPEADLIGLRPVEDVLEIPDWADMKELIQWGHENKIFPMYWRERWLNDSTPSWNQNGLPWCWTWGLCGCVMDLELRTGRFVSRLAPTSLGRSVNYRRVGNSLDRTIATAMRYGICEDRFARNEHGVGESNFKQGWLENCQKHRPLEFFETNCYRQDDRYIARQAMALFQAGASGYVAHFWWGHALGLIGLIWDESKPNNLIWPHGNSHNNRKPTLLSGSKGSPDELYGVRALA